MKIRAVGTGLFPCGRTDRETDRHDEAKSRSSQIRERASKHFTRTSKTLQEVMNLIRILGGENPNLNQRMTNLVIS
jgi:hypothetical protein